MNDKRQPPTQRLILSRFDMSKIKFNKDQKQGPVIVFIGRRGTGKSFLIRDLLFYHQTIPIGMVMSATEDVSPFYDAIVPKMCIHYEYSTYQIECLIRRQKTICKKIKSDMETYGRSNTDGRAFAILDDCLYDDRWTRDVLMRYIFMCGRHIKIMLIITMQAPLGIPPALRNNVDYTFILNNPLMNERMKIYKNYASVFPSFEAFCQIMDACTNNRQCLVIDNTTESTKLEDNVFWYKGDVHPDFKLCEKRFWEISKNITDDDMGEHRQLSARRRNQPVIQVVQQMH